MNLHCLFRWLNGALMLMVSAGIASAAERPNILLILADDLGYSADSWNPEMMIRLPEDRPQPEFEEGDYFDSDALTGFALKFLKQSRNESPGQPWFLYVSYHAPHFPVQAPREYREKYAEVYKRGWDELRDKRLTRMKELGVVKEETILSPRSSIPIPDVAKRHGVPGDLERNPPWDTIPEDRRTDLARRMAVYAGMVDNMDHNIGRMVSDLDENGELANTLILCRPTRQMENGRQKRRRGSRPARQTRLAFVRHGKGSDRDGESCGAISRKSP